MTQPTTDTRAVVRAIDALTTQVGRVADHMATPVVTIEDVAADDATTPATECSAQHHGFPSDHRQCIRAAHHHGDHIDENGYHWSDTVAVYPVDPGTARINHWHPLSEQLTKERQELAGMVGAFIDAQMRVVPAADEDALRTARRDSLLVLLSRATRGVLTLSDGGTLRQLVEDEIRDSNTARAVAAGNQHHVQVMYAELTAAQAAIERVRDAAHLNRQGLLSPSELHAVIGPVTVHDVIEQQPDSETEDLRAKLNEATTTLRRVRTLHARTTVETTTGPADACSSCTLDGMSYPWPCETTEALAGPNPDSSATEA